ncbi:MAG: CDP-diacylglycerol--serine O-phosphatidyltransferase [Acidobacteria bacterium]|nr:CDP-diacylglycerol--serine O-phosphatidyltransferase [Acidobacteriota bacterium]
MGAEPGKPIPERRGVRRGVYVLPTLFTVGNIFCGYLAIDAAFQASTDTRYFDQAAMLLFLAGILDGLDGRVARLTGTTSAFGEQLDSLADVISFGLAPAYLAYRWALTDFHRWGLLVSFLFVVCGACRLARFNVQVHVVDKRYFVGLPIPAAAGAVVGLIWILPDPPDPTWRIPFLCVVLGISYLMVSTIKYRSFKDIDLKSRRTPLLVPLIAATIAAIFILQEKALTALLLIFALSGPVAKVIGILSGRRELPPPPVEKPA